MSIFIKKICVSFKGFFLLFGIISSFILIYYFTLSFLLDFELQVYRRKKDPKIEWFPPSADVALDNIRIYIYFFVFTYTYICIFIRINK